MSNKEKALALIGTFVSGDLEKAKSLLAPEYKQQYCLNVTVDFS